VSGPGENVGADAPARATGAPTATTNDGAVNANASPQGLPLLKPPYGRITAIDLDRGEFVWQAAHGETPDSVRNHPALKGLAVPRTGQSGARRRARHEDARHCRRSARDDRVRAAARRDAARLRQGDRERGRRRLHAGAAVGHADDLCDWRPAVPSSSP